MTDAVSLPPAKELDDVLECAKAAAQIAGDLIRKEVGAEVIKTKFNPKDLLTKVDPECQDIIEKTVLGAFPNHCMLGEESVEPGMDASAAALKERMNEKWLWIVDPIDGTTNFASGMPLAAVSIGVAYKGQLVVGVIYDPFHDEMFSAKKGCGAFLNGERIKVGTQATIGEAVVAAGSPPNVLSLGPCMRGCVALAPHVRTLRLIGSAAIMYAWVSCGRLTAYWEPDLNSWDSAAGVVLITEAGGRASDTDRGGDFRIDTRAVLTSNGLVHDSIWEILEKANAVRCDEMPQIF